MSKCKLIKAAVWCSISAGITGSILFRLGSENFILPRRRALEFRHIQASQNPHEYGFDLLPYEVITGDGTRLKAFLIELSDNPGIGFDPRSIRPVTQSARIAVPVMVVHGGRDQVIPPAQGLLVFEAMRQPVKVWREVPGGYHGNVLATGGDALYQKMIGFRNTHAPLNLHKFSRNN